MVFENRQVERSWKEREANPCSRERAANAFSLFMFFPGYAGNALNNIRFAYTLERKIFMFLFSRTGGHTV